jgi:endonuclease/exonuclease/phosphatase family metal-dependent hydrolase
MPFKIAFWNINMGTGSNRNRHTTFKSWCAAVKPDLLLLEEVSDTLRNDLPTWAGMAPITYVNTLDKNLKVSTKQLWALQKGTHNFQGKVLSFPGLEAKRRLIKVTNRTLQNFALWVIHANASSKGGKAAVKAVNDYLDKNDGAIVGGDFNCPFINAGARARAPRSWQQNQNLRLTQWNKVAGITTAPNQRLHLVTPGRTGGPILQTKIEPHRVIDYVMTGDDRKAVANPNCPDEATWRDILTFFDHCPVVYNLT